MKVLRLTYVPGEKELEGKNAIIDYGLFLTHLVPLSAELEKLGVKSDFFSSGREKKGAETTSGFPVHRTPLPQTPFFLPYGYGVKKFLAFQHRDYDAIHAHNPAYAYYFAIDKNALCGMPLFITWHGLYPYGKYALSSLHSFFLRRLAKFAYFIAINSASMGQLRELGVPEERARLISTGVDTEKFRESRGIRKHFIFIGRLVKWKNPLTVLKAFCLLAKKYPNERLSFIGTGPLENGLKEEAKKLGISRKVKFAGAIEYSKLPMLYSSAKALVVPHLHDSFGKTVIEALACGCPAICTDTDMPEDLKEYVISIPAKEAENHELLARKMMQAIENFTEETARAKKGRSIVEKNYSWTSKAAKTKEYYDSVLGDFSSTKK